jgi:hypothetical protein
MEKLTDRHGYALTEKKILDIREERNGTYYGVVVGDLYNKDGNYSPLYKELDAKGWISRMDERNNALVYRTSRQTVGAFKVYNEAYAKTSAYGWYEVMKISSHEWAVIEYYPDGSADYRTFEESKAVAVAVARRMASSNKTQAPYFIDHGVKYYNKEAY